MSLSPLRHASASRLALVIAVYLLVGITGFAVVKRAGAVTVPTATIFASTERPAVAASTDASSVELGLRFSVAVPGELTGIRFYKGQATPERTPARCGASRARNCDRSPSPARPPLVGRRLGSPHPSG